MGGSVTIENFLIGVLSIVLIDIVLAGDNAVVIGMASRNLPPAQRRNAVLLGTVGAVGLRILFTVMATLLLQIPLLQAIGGVLLLWIAIKLLTQHKEHEVSEGQNLWEAVRTIIIADAVMSLDNVLAIAGAAHGHIGLVVFGLLLSIPIVVGGSQLVATLINRFPIVLYVGAGVLAWAAGQMLAEDPIVHEWIGAWLSGAIPIAAVVGVIGAGLILQRRAQHEPAAEAD